MLQIAQPNIQLNLANVSDWPKKLKDMQTTKCDSLIKTKDLIHLLSFIHTILCQAIEYYTNHH